MSNQKNRLYYGDNLQVLREYIPDSSVDLVYLDPPFNSRQDYNVLFAERDGSRSASQITAFKDTWEWNIEAERSYEEVVERGGTVADALRAFRTLLGHSDIMAYLVMMAPRLIELRRVLKENGSIYLHCDPTASHYLRILMDGVFGPIAFVNEIIWKRYGAHNDVGQGSKHFGRVHDTIMFFSKSQNRIWNQLFMPLNDAYVASTYRNEEGGRRFRSTPLTGPGGEQKGNPVYEWNGHTRAWRYSKETMQTLHDEGRLYYSKTGYASQKLFLDESRGVPVQDTWNDIASLSGSNAERLGYPTQKPEALLERILKASSNEGDVVLDPFCGCGTTVQVAQRLNRRWIGIDITHLAIGLIKTRLDDSFGPDVRKTYEVIGEPTDLAGAEQLALENKYQFQYWALGLCGGRPTEGIKKGADRGIDGRLYFHEATGGESKQIIFSVKGGRNISVAEVRDLIGVLQREKASIGVYISFAEPTRPMLREAAEAGFYTSADGSKYPRVQLLTIEGLMKGTQRLERPLHVRDVTFKKAPRARPDAARNLTLDLGGDA
jgi:DNA modification methylase